MELLRPILELGVVIPGIPHFAGSFDSDGFSLSVQKRITRQPYCKPTLSLQFCRNRKIQSKGCALSQLAVYFNGAVMGFHNGFCQRQTQPDALCIL